LILSIWLSSICQPILEWLDNRLPLINRCQAKRSRPAIAAFLIIFLVLVVILPIVIGIPTIAVPSIGI
ncbi:unnamed protein product, partial [Rotaria sp. Silwood2]